MGYDSACLLCFITLCQQSDGSHARLFLDCSFSRLVWADVLRKNLILRSSGDWDFEIDWACIHYKGKSFRASPPNLPWQLLFTISGWKGIPEFLLKSAATDIISAIVANVRDGVCSWGRFPYSFENAAVCNNWSISSSILGRSRG